jgi:hypothetical protein
MKNVKNYMAALLLLVVCATGFAQAKKPTIMVMPSEVWCNANGYMTVYDNQGTKTKIPDYKRALQENGDLLTVITKINGIMADRGFPLKDMAAAIKTLEADAAENNIATSKTGAGVSESPLDKLKKVAKADIIIELYWAVNATGPKKSITFNLKGLDAYTDKQVAYATGTGAPSFTSELPLLLEEAVSAHMDGFNAGLQKHFDDLFENGREVIVKIKKFDSWGEDFTSEFGGKELTTIIEDWISANTVKNRFNLDQGDEVLLFEQVRIPLYGPTGKATDTRAFVKLLQDELKTKYSIPSKLTMKGLGQAVLIIGDK